MKKVALVIAFILGLVSMSAVKAQYNNFGASKVILKSGDLSKLKGEKDLKLEYDYSTLKVGAYNTEAEYVDLKVKEYNEKEKGKGDKWKAGWINSRKERFHPKFEALFNKAIKKTGIVASESASGKYKMIVKTTFIEPGFNVGMAKKPAFCNYEFVIVETANPSTVVAELYLNSVVGSQSMGFDFDSGSRIAESYAKGGKMLGKFMAKQMK